MAESRRFNWKLYFTIFVGVTALLGHGSLLSYMDSIGYEVPAVLEHLTSIIEVLVAIAIFLQFDFVQEGLAETFPFVIEIPNLTESSGFNFKDSFLRLLKRASPRILFALVLCLSLLALIQLILILFEKSISDFWNSITIDQRNNAILSVFGAVLISIMHWVIQRLVSWFRGAWKSHAP
jgi:hypothetical protein